MNTAFARGGIVVLSGKSHEELATLICNRLEINLGKCDVIQKANKETKVEINESIRGKDVYIIQTGTKQVNNDIMEMLIMAYACKTSCARNIVGIMPYLPYCKQSKMRKRGCVVSRLLADMITKAGFSHMITMDLHQKEIQGFFNFPVDNLRASSFIIQYIKENIPDYGNAVMVAKNPVAVARASSYSERLHIGFAVIHGEERVPESETDDGRASPPPQDDDESLMSRITSADTLYDLPISVQSRYFRLDSRSLPALHKKEKPPMNVVGEVEGKTAIIVTDLIDEVESYIAAAELLRDRGAVKIYVAATHGLLSRDAPQLIHDSCIDEVIVTNTVPHDAQKSRCHKIKTVDVSPLFAEAVRRIHNQESMSHLFKNVGLTE